MHKKDALWIGNMKKEFQGKTRQISVVIGTGDMKGCVVKVPNSKALGIDGIHDFLLKRWPAVHKRLAAQLSNCIQKGKSLRGWSLRGQYI